MYMTELEAACRMRHPGRNMGCLCKIRSTGIQLHAYVVELRIERCRALKHRTELSLVNSIRTI